MRGCVLGTVHTLTNVQGKLHRPISPSLGQHLPPPTLTLDGAHVSIVRVAMEIRTAVPRPRSQREQVGFHQETQERT